MKDSEIIEMAKQADDYANTFPDTDFDWWTEKRDIAFARLVQKKQREIDAGICDPLICGSQGFAGPTCCILPPGHSGKHKYGTPVARTATSCAAAILAQEES